MAGSLGSREFSLLLLSLLSYVMHLSIYNIASGYQYFKEISFCQIADTLYPFRLNTILIDKGIAKIDNFSNE